MSLLRNVNELIGSAGDDVTGVQEEIFNHADSEEMHAGDDGNSSYNTSHEHDDTAVGSKKSSSNMSTVASRTRNKRSLAGKK